MINTISNMILPVLILVIIIYGFIKKVNIYDSFVDGAKEGIDIGVNIFPYLLGMLLGVNLLIKSGFIEFIIDIIKPISMILKIPSEIIPMAFVRPISGTASIAIMSDIFSNFGTDSFLGRIASTLQGSTDTTLYVLTLYFGSIGIKRVKYAMWVGLFADFIGIVSSILFVSIFF